MTGDLSANLMVTAHLSGDRNYDRKVTEDLSGDRKVTGTVTGTMTGVWSSDGIGDRRAGQEPNPQPVSVHPSVPTTCWTHWCQQPLLCRPPGLVPPCLVLALS